jgi:hypothetical protein
MKISSEARAARKDAQLARLAAKADSDIDYSEFYAGQPLQLARAEMNERIAAARQAQRQAVKELEIAQATGINLEIAEAAVRSTALSLSGLQTLKRARFKPSTTLALSAGGEA